jgi:hypothetical protein
MGNKALLRLLLRLSGNIRIMIKHSFLQEGYSFKNLPNLLIHLLKQFLIFLITHKIKFSEIKP